MPIEKPLYMDRFNYIEIDLTYGRIQIQSSEDKLPKLVAICEALIKKLPSYASKRDQ